MKEEEEVGEIKKEGRLRERVEREGGKSEGERERRRRGSEGEGGERGKEEEGEIEESEREGGERNNITIIIFPL